MYQDACLFSKAEYFKTYTAFSEHFLFYLIKCWTINLYFLFLCFVLMCNLELNLYGQNTGPREKEGSLVMRNIKIYFCMYNGMVLITNNLKSSLKAANF